MLIKEKIKQIIKKAILGAQRQGVLPKFEIGDISVTHPERLEFGDYTSNVPMRFAKLAKMRPEKVAQLIAHRILTFPEMKDILCRVEIKKPGFINLTLERTFLIKELEKILKEKEKYGDQEVKRRRRIQVEFISANPTGSLHVGHGRGAFFGDALCHILKKAGYKVAREFYVNDSKQSKQIKMLGELLVGKENPYKTPLVEKFIKEIKKTRPDLKKMSHGELGYLLAQKIQIRNRQFIEQKLKIHFDIWFSEEDFYRLGKIAEAITWLKTFGLTYEKEGALWMKTKQFGDDEDRVLVRKNGEATYFLSDIVYHRDKFERFDRVINVWGADHHGYVKRMQAACKAMGRSGDLDILISQMVRLIKAGREFKISKRKGRVVDLEWLIDEVGLDVARFFYLVKSLDAHMDFDLDKARDISEKNPVYYVQYAYARICSIFTKSKVENQKSKVNLDLLEHPAELILIRELTKFPELIIEISKNYAVHHLPTFAISLADKFHDFYEKCRVLSEEKKLTEARLALILATKIILKNVLDLLGVKAPEKM